ncbi:MAG: YgjP-like metallopeptidase domain-containing protein [Erythrobacter sp.]|uniref:M48 family metallopeptidase n=1 Tax=Erythrobacter sp. TaxID=1042 RepID=UPI003266C364
MIDWLKRSHLEPEIELNEVMVPIILKRHRTAKRLTLRLAPDGSEIRITLPQWARSTEAVAFANSRQEWLAQQHAKVPRKIEVGDGATIQFRGSQLRIDWNEAHARKPALCANTIAVGGPKPGLEGRIKRWLEKEALALFERDVAHYTKVAELDLVPVGLSRAQKRWGSCSDGGASGSKRIRLNWRLVQAPDSVRQSVAAHEVAHLVHFDHSPAFHALLGSIYEGDIKEADRWLKTNGRGLYSSFG